MWCVQDVANAIGAALGTVGATVDSIESLVVGEGREGETENERVKRARLDVLRRARERAISEAVRKGAIPSEVYIHTEDVVDVTYVKNKLHVRVKAIGPLRDAATSDDQVEVPPSVEDNPHWPFASADDREKDRAANLPSPNVEGVYVRLYLPLSFPRTLSLFLCLPLSVSFFSPPLSPPPSLFLFLSFPLPVSSSLYFPLSPPLSLPLPLSNTMHMCSGGVWLLSGHDVECVAVGAGLLGCGGGGDPNTGRLLARQQLDAGKTIKVVNPLR